jgi:hypothetical protein
MQPDKRAHTGPERPAPTAAGDLHEAPTATGPTPGAGAPPAPPALAGHPRYRVLGLLGAGGMGAVYKAEHLRMERLVALKVMSPELMDRPEMVERFHREVKAAARLAHPNIVTAYDADQAGDTHFLVMEYVEGTSLAEKVRQEGPLPVALACEYVRQCALGLQHAFESGMAHRDVKPHNLMLTPGGQVKILDFGLARFVREAATARAGPGPTPGGAGAAASALTETGTLMGTADYIAPEQATDPAQADVRADVYSLGATLYYLLAGHPPFPEGTALDKLTAHCERAPKPLTELRRDVPPALARVVERMMAKAPARRYQTPAEVAEALAPFLAAPPRRTPRRLLAVSAAACALALLAGAILWAWAGSRHTPGPTAPAPEKVAKARRPAPGEGVPAKYRGSIRRGLDSLARAQRDDGHWEAAGGQYPSAITALAGMALLMEGSTTGEGRYAGPVRKAVDWLTERGQPNGLLTRANDPSDHGHYMFGHGYAMLFLATAYGQEEDGGRREKLGAILSRAVAFTADAQSTRGGWGYLRAAEGKNFDESASTIIQLQGLRAARNAGVVVPKRLFDIDYLRKSTTPRGGIIYSTTNAGGGERPALTAAALACMLTAGDYDSDLARKWLTFCRQTIPLDQPALRRGHDEYTHYYYAQALYILGEKGYETLFPDSPPAERLTWSKYRAALFDALVARQAADGAWNTRPLGPVYATACYLTILQLDDGALPIYRRQ